MRLPRTPWLHANKYMLRKVGLSLLVLSLTLARLDSAFELTDPALKVVANLLPVFFLWAIFLGLSRRFGTSLLISTAVIFVTFGVSSAKHAHLGVHLVFQDVFLAPLLLQGWDVLSHYTNLWAAIAGIVILLSAIALSFRERPLHLLVTPLLVTLSLSGFYTISAKHLSPNSLYGPRAHGASPWGANSPAETQGLLASLVSAARSTNIQPPTYDENIIESFYQQHSLPKSARSNLNPDIILWLGESYFDPGTLAEVNTCEHLPTYCELANTGITSEIDVPTFGGNTTRTEFEVLTGIPFAMLGSDDYPYLTTVHSQFDSIAWALKASAYRTVAIHTHLKTYWQRHRAFPLLGFDEYIGEHDIENRTWDGFWVSDDTLASEVINQLEVAQAPAMVFAISMEGHGPFGNQKNLSSERLSQISTPKGLQPPAAKAWREYIYHAQNTSYALKRVKQYIDARKRPTLLVFFGDHLPGLNNVFDQLPFKNGKSRSNQKTPVLALANYPIASNWLPEHSYELGLWSLELAQSRLTPNLQQLVQATSIMHSTKGASALPAVKAMQLRQLNSSTPSSTEIVLKQ